MRHVHHIIPKHMGGTDDPSNLVSLTVEEHAAAHKELYEKYGKKEDYIAWKGLEGTIGIEELVSIRCSIGGKAGVKKLEELKICSYYNEELRRKASDRGREKAKEMCVGFYDSKLQSELGKRGGPKNKGFVWITDGKINIKYTRPMQEKQSVEEFLEENKTFEIGRVEKTEKVTCPNCGKSGSSSAFKGHHFDNCSTVKTKTWKMKTKKTCPHCNKTGSGGAMNRFHFDNCKHKK